MISSRSAQLGVRSDHGLTLPGELTAALEKHTRGLEGRLDRVEWRRRIRCAGDGAHEQLLQRRRPSEQNFPLVGEVTEEGPLREPGTLGDLGHGGVLEPPLPVERHGGLLEPAAAVRFPSSHEPILVMGDDSG